MVLGQQNKHVEKTTSIPASHTHINTLRFTHQIQAKTIKLPEEMLEGILATLDKDFLKRTKEALIYKEQIGKSNSIKILKYP